MIRNIRKDAFDKTQGMRDTDLMHRYVVFFLSPYDEGAALLDRRDMAAVETGPRGAAAQQGIIAAVGAALALRL